MNILIYESFLANVIFKKRLRYLPFNCWQQSLVFLTHWKTDFPWSTSKISNSNAFELFP